MGKKYEYWTEKNGEDFVINLEVVSFSGSKGTFSSKASDPDEYFGSTDIEWKPSEDISHMTDAEVGQMEEWLINEHSEYLADLAYYD